VNIHHLVDMANQIGHFHESLPDRVAAETGTANHIRRFWDPRMRRALLTHVDQQGGAGLDPLVLDAIRTHRAELTPPEAARKS
jgi:formate dehydrogenase subunit delta